MEALDLLDPQGQQQVLVRRVLLLDQSVLQQVDQIQRRFSLSLFPQGQQDQAVQQVLPDLLVLPDPQGQMGQMGTMVRQDPQGQQDPQVQIQQ